MCPFTYSFTSARLGFSFILGRRRRLLLFLLDVGLGLGYFNIHLTTLEFLLIELLSCLFSLCSSLKGYKAITERTAAMLDNGSFCTVDKI